MITRRTLLVTIGGVAGSMAIPKSVPGSGAPAPLPPGLYLPSIDHLGHALMSNEPFHAIPAGCPTDYVRPRIGSFSPAFFKPGEFGVIRRLAQLLLGSEESTAGEVAVWIDLQVASAEAVREAARRLDPHHRALAVSYYGAAEMNQLEISNPEEVCRQGLEWLSGASRSYGADDFLSLASEQQSALLADISDTRIDKHNENSGTRLFSYLKPELIRGYYTSLAGLRELDFKGNAFYARSPGCNTTAERH